MTVVLPDTATNATDFDLLLKFLILGNSNAGKTSLLLRYFDDRYTPSFITTVGIDFKVRTLVAHDGRRIKLQVWDTAGQERFRTITNAYYRGTMGILLVYDVCDLTSFQALTDVWVPNIRQLAPREAIVMLVANKIDMPEYQHVVSRRAGETLACAEGFLFCEASSKTNTNVSMAFEELTRATLGVFTVPPPAAAESLRLSASPNNGNSNNSRKCCS